MMITLSQPQPQPPTNQRPAARLSPAEFAAIALIFPVGTRVRYLDSADQEQGQGQVIALARATNDALITVQFDTLGTHNILSRFLTTI